MYGNDDFTLNRKQRKKNEIEIVETCVADWKINHKTFFSLNEKSLMKVNILINVIMTSSD